ncbi:MAG: DNA mismatch repair protein MutS, partial [Bacteroidota bacterium]
RKLVPGGSKHSFGIHVAKMAGMPKSILVRATEILDQLEQKVIDQDAEVITPSPEQDNHLQLSIFETVDETAGKLKEAVQKIDINNMTPMQALIQLNELRNLLDET